ncbi:MAG: helix-turn-helix transcriptional regulator [Hyphomicrobiales bacterium]|nr:helix-turn-helix transcriptional regulator [Hyphomicrobiales bacterium]MCP5001461.1 helix-turn-helix transcriptional regulator [Hyphomicrobiales bacterium]
MFGGESYDPPSPTGPPAAVHGARGGKAQNQNTPKHSSHEHNGNINVPNPDIPVASEAALQSNRTGSEAPAWEPPTNARLGNVLPDQRARIPVYGQAVGGVDGEFVMNGDRLDDVFAPPSLSSVTGAYAVYVAGESMEPRYFDGEIVFVNPTKRVRRGDFVIAQVQVREHGPKLAYVKRFVRWNAEELVLSQYNPEKELRFTANQVISVHLVVMGGAV